MKGLKLIRRMELAGLIRWFPVDGAPVIQLEAGRFRFYWTQPAIRRDGEVTYHFPSPEALEEGEWDAAYHSNGIHRVLRSTVKFHAGTAAREWMAKEGACPRKN